MILIKGIALAPDYDFRTVPPRFLTPMQRELETRLRHMLDLQVENAGLWARPRCCGANSKTSAAHDLRAAALTRLSARLNRLLPGEHPKLVNAMIAKQILYAPGMAVDVGAVTHIEK